MMDYRATEKLKNKRAITCVVFHSTEYRFVEESTQSGLNKAALWEWEACSTTRFSEESYGNLINSNVALKLITSNKSVPKYLLWSPMQIKHFGLLLLHDNTLSVKPLPRIGFILDQNLTVLGEAVFFVTDKES